MYIQKEVLFNSVSGNYVCLETWIMFSSYPKFTIPSASLLYWSASTFGNILQSAIDNTYISFSKMSASNSANPVSVPWDEVILWDIWGDEPGFQVFAESLYRGSRVIFQYSTDRTSRKTLQNRIVIYYHGYQAADAKETYADMNELRRAILWSITKFWNSSSNHPCLFSPDATVEIYQEDSGWFQWRLSHSCFYDGYLKQLLPLPQVLQETVPSDSYEDPDLVEIKSLTYHGGFKGRGDHRLVSLQSHPDLRYVFRGLDLAKYMKTGSTFQYRRNSCYHEIRTIHSLPSHPHIISKNMRYVTAGEISKPGQSLICGTLYPYLKNGTLKDEVNKARKTNTRLALVAKAKWCFQMASAIVHTHYQAQTYHMDIRLSKFLLDGNRDLILIDWEQSGASPCTIAPEADGSYDAEIQGDGLQAEPTYSIYRAPKEGNNPSSWPHWNVFPIWRKKCPQALEAAEVFSLGRTMWMLLEEVDEGNPNERVTAYWEKDTPMEWKAVVGHCIKTDPTERLTLRNIMEFWEAEMRKFV